MLVVEPRPRRNWHRYSSEQMSGPLPRIMNKYLPSRYAETMVGRGEIMFSTLSLGFAIMKTISVVIASKEHENTFPLAGSK